MDAKKKLVEKSERGQPEKHLASHPPLIKTNPLPAKVDEMHRKTPPFLRLALIVAAYLCSFLLIDLITRQFAIHPGVVAWYPPAGLTYALLLVFGVAFTPAVTITLFISSLFIYRMPQPIYFLFLWALIISLIYSAATAFLCKRIRFDWQLRKFRDVTWFVFAVVLVSALLAVLSVSSSALSSNMPRSEVLRAIFNWWIGETVGALTVTPFLLIYVMPGLKRFVEGQTVRLPTRRSFPPPTLSAIGQTASIALTLYLTFGAPILAEFHPLYLISLPLIWIALQRGLKSISVALLALNSGVVLALWLFRFNPAQLGELELLMIVNSIIGLLMGAVVTERKQVEKVLRYKDELLQLTSEMAKVGGWEFDTLTLEGTWTDEVARIHDLDPTNPTNVNLGISFYMPDSRIKIEQAIKEAIESKQPYDLELQMISAKGNQKWARTMGLPIIEDGKVIKIRGIFQDITKRKQAEEELIVSNKELLFQNEEKEKRAAELVIANKELLFQNEEKEKRAAELVLANKELLFQTAELAKASERYRSTLDNMLEGCQIIGFDWRYLYINAAAEKHNHRPNEELLGKIYMDMWAGIENTEVFRVIRRCLEERISRQMENEFVFPDGTNGWFELGIQPVPEGIFILSQNITERKRAEMETLRRLQNIQALQIIDQAIAGSLDLNLTLNVVLEQVKTQLNIDAAAVLLLNPHTQILEFASGLGFRSKAIERSHQRLGEGHSGRAALERRMVSVTDLLENSTQFDRAPLLADEGFVTYFGTPLIAKGQVYGVLEVFHRSPFAPDENWLEFFKILAGQAAIAVDNASLFTDLMHSNAELFAAYDSTIEGWSHALDLRDKETEGHTLRVTEMTMKLARAAGITEAELVHVRRGALLHDIGKMGVPDHILLKPDKLTDEEWVAMRKHPTFAFELLLPIVYLRPALDIPYCHHEKWDGSGYPRGLKGEQIPLMARLFAIVDVWDALRSDRPYRQGWSKEKVIEHIKSLSGTHFEPKTVELFLKMMNEDEKNAG